jgi:HEAT repeat protein
MTKRQSFLRCVLFALSILVVTHPASSVERNAELSRDEALLREMVIPSAGEALVDYFRMRVSILKRKNGIVDAVRALGAEEFEVREQAMCELRSIGSLAAESLRQHLNDSDKELASRARKCLEHISQSPGPLLTEAAIRVMVAKDPKGVVNVLVDYFPYAEDEQVEDTILFSLEQICQQRRKIPDLLRTLANDPLPVRRAVAAHVMMSRSGYPVLPEERTFLTDADPRVRFFAGRALLRCGNGSAISALISVLEDGPLPRAWEAESLLRQLTVDTRGPETVLQATKETRVRCRHEWEEWWDRHLADKVLQKESLHALKKPQIVFTDLDDGIVEGISINGKKLWRVDGLKGPVDVQVLTSNRLLITENHGGRVTERDLLGRLLWEKHVPSPINAWRRSNGNTVIALRSGLVEFSAAGVEIASVRFRDEIICARPLRTGEVAVLTERRLEYGTEGFLILLSTNWNDRKTIFVEKGIRLGDRFRELSDGHFLLVGDRESLNGEVELSRGGDLIWRGSYPGNCCDLSLDEKCLLLGGTRGITRINRQEGGFHEIIKTEGRVWSIQLLR